MGSRKIFTRFTTGKTAKSRYEVKVKFAAPAVERRESSGRPSRVRSRELECGFLQAGLRTKRNGPRKGAPPNRKGSDSFRERSKHANDGAADGIANPRLLPKAHSPSGCFGSGRENEEETAEGCRNRRSYPRELHSISTVMGAAKTTVEVQLLSLQKKRRASKPRHLD